MPTQKGYGQLIGEFSGEIDTFTCSHCSKVVFFKAERDLTPGIASAKPQFHDMGGFCRLCMKNICGPCCDKNRCRPWERQLEDIEKKATRQRWLCEALGQ